MFMIEHGVYDRTLVLEYGVYDVYDRIKRLNFRSSAAAVQNEAHAVAPPVATRSPNEAWIFPET